jgi:hypothetical protein
VAICNHASHGGEISVYFDIEILQKEEIAVAESICDVIFDLLCLLADFSTNFMENKKYNDFNAICFLSTDIR